MSNYHQQWKDAKTKFENDTGMKKPSEMGKVFGVSYRKGTGIDDALKDLDKLFPASLLVPVSAKAENAITAAIENLTTSADEYSDLLDRSLKDEKELVGKDASKVYRDLKILKASLSSIVEAAKSDRTKLIAARESVQQGVERGILVTVQYLKGAVHSLEAGAKASLLRAQLILKDPTPATFNAHFAGGKAAREVSQALLQFVKFTMPEELTAEHAIASRERALQNAHVYEAARELAHVCASFKERILELSRETGTSAKDATIGRMCNAPIFLPLDASTEDVIEATKQFISQCKKAVEIAQEMKRAQNVRF